MLERQDEALRREKEREREREEAGGSRGTLLVSGWQSSGCSCSCLGLLISWQSLSAGSPAVVWWELSVVVRESEAGPCHVVLSDDCDVVRPP